MTAERRPRVTWLHLAAFAFATAIATVLAIFAVIAAPVPPAPGVSALYVAAAVYVPLAIWMGLWGCLAGYVSCFLLGLYVGYSIPFSLIWSFCDFVEGLIPLLAFRLAKVDPDFSVRNPRALRAMTCLVVLGTAAALVGVYLGLRPVMYTGFALTAAGIVVGACAGDRKTWGLYIVFGIILAALGSGLIGAGTLTKIPGLSPSPPEAFKVIFVGWVLGDIIVLATIGTLLLVTLTPVVKRTPIYVRGWFA